MLTKALRGRSWTEILNRMNFMLVRKSVRHFEIDLLPIQERINSYLHTIRPPLGHGEDHATPWMGLLPYRGWRPDFVLAFEEEEWGEEDPELSEDPDDSEYSYEYEGSEVFGDSRPRLLMRRPLLVPLGEEIVISDDEGGPWALPYLIELAPHAPEEESFAPEEAPDSPEDAPGGPEVPPAVQPPGIREDSVDGAGLGAPSPPPPAAPKLGVKKKTKTFLKKKNKKRVQQPPVRRAPPVPRQEIPPPSPSSRRSVPRTPSASEPESDETPHVTPTRRASEPETPRLTPTRRARRPETDETPRLTPSRSAAEAPWEPEDDDMLRKAIKLRYTWDNIAPLFPHRSAVAVVARQAVLKIPPLLRRRPLRPGIDWPEPEPDRDPNRECSDR